jgi:hypothetical protein
VRREESVEITVFLDGSAKAEPNVTRDVINYTEQVFGSPRPGLFERAKDVRAEGLKARFGFGAWFGVDSRMV